MKKIAKFLKKSFFVTKKDIPKTIYNWISSKIGSVTKFSVEQATKININTPWHENDKVYYALFKLIKNDAEITDMQFTRSGIETKGINSSGNVPSGYVMVEAHTYPKAVHIYTADDVTKFISSKNYDLSDEELLILQFAQAFISSARPVFKDTTLYQSLIEKGLLKGNRSITVEGKNVLLDSIDQLHSIQSKRDYYENNAEKLFSKNEYEVKSAINTIR